MPLAWIIAATLGGAYAGTIVENKITGQNRPADDITITKVMLYAGAGLALAYGFKKVFR